MGRPGLQQQQRQRGRAATPAGASQRLGFRQRASTTVRVASVQQEAQQQQRSASVEQRGSIACSSTVLHTASPSAFRAGNTSFVEEFRIR